MNNFVNHSLWLEYLLSNEYLNFVCLFSFSIRLFLPIYLFRGESLQIVIFHIWHLTEMRPSCFAANLKTTWMFCVTVTTRTFNWPKSQNFGLGQFLGSFVWQYKAGCWRENSSCMPERNFNKQEKTKKKVTRGLTFTMLEILIEDP